MGPDNDVEHYMLYNITDNTIQTVWHIFRYEFNAIIEEILTRLSFFYLIFFVTFWHQNFDFFPQKERSHTQRIHSCWTMGCEMGSFGFIYLQRSQLWWKSGILYFNFVDSICIKMFVNFYRWHEHALSSIYVDNLRFTCVKINLLYKIQLDKSRLDKKSVFSFFKHCFFDYSYNNKIDFY